MAYKVLIPQKIAETGVAYLEEHGIDVIHGCENCDKTIRALLKDADGLIARTRPYPSSLLEDAAKLKVIGRHGIGVDNLDLAAIRTRNIVLTYTPQANLHAVAEHVMALILTIAKQIPYFNDVMRRDGFQERMTVLSTELRGKTLGLIGCGNIGRQVAEKARCGFGMDVLVFDPYIGAGAVPGCTVVPTLDDLLCSSDFLSLHVPLTDGTRNLLGERELTLMKRTAVLINTSRGGVVDENALHAALVRRDIAAAGLDVFAQEPPPGDHPLLSLKNLIATPHSAAIAKETLDVMALQLAEDIVRVFNGEKPLWGYRL